jgi:hypothetical protein
MTLNLTRIVLFGALFAMAFSCSEDDDATSSDATLEKASLSFAGETKAITPPAAMASSQDEHAMIANGYIASANAMTSVLSYFTPPSGATRSSTKITAANGREAATATEYLVYTWSDPNVGSIAYQISSESDKWVFEIFYKAKDASSWLAYVYAEEKKDKSEGLMKIYNLFGDGELAYSYTWKRTDDILTLVLSESLTGENVTITIAINEKTAAGSVVYTSNGITFAEIEWDAKGNGSWVMYEEDGVTVVDEGKWTV